MEVTRPGTARTELDSVPDTPVCLRVILTSRYLSFVPLVNYGGNPHLWKLPAPAPHAPSLTRFIDRYGQSSVGCCCDFTDDGLYCLLWGRAHCPSSAVLCWPAPRVPIPGWYKWFLCFLPLYMQIGHMGGECCLLRSLPSPGVSCQRGS